MNRIEKRLEELKQENKKAFITYTTAGLPDLQTTAKLIFAQEEAGAFTVMLRLSDTQFASVYEQLQPYAKEYVDNRYPCGNGGWIHYRVCEEAHMEDIQRLLFLRCD